MITTGFYRVAFHRKKLHAKAAFICNYHNVYVLNFFQKPSVVIVPTSQCVYCLMGVDFFVSSTNVRHVMKLIVNMLSEDNLLYVPLKSNFGPGIPKQMMDSHY